MEIEDSNSGNFSFLELLMAPDENDQFTLSSPSSDFITQQQQIPQNYNSMPSFDNFPENPFSNFPENPENMSNYLLQIPFYSNNFNYVQNINTQFLPPLPELLSYENTPIEPPSNSYLPSPLPELHSPLPEKDDYSLGAIVASHYKTTTKTTEKSKKQRSCRKKQNKVSEKLYNLRKLLPGDNVHRKCTADMLKEAYEYIQFLQAKLKALQSMQIVHYNTDLNVDENVNVNDKVGCKRCRCGEGGSGSGWSRVDDEGVVALEELSKEELLKMVVDSAAAQVVMAENGWCMVSEEQVEFVNKVYARQKIVNQILSSLPL